MQKVLDEDRKQSIWVDENSQMNRPIPRKEGPAPTKEEVQPGPTFDFIVLPDRPTAQKTDRTFAFLDAGRYAEAIPLLEELLESNLDYFIPDDKSKSVPSGKLTDSPVTVQKTFRSLLRLRISELPSDAREMLNLLIEPKAFRLLEEVTQTGDTTLLTRKGDRFSMTPSGRKALLLVSQSLSQRGFIFAADERLKIIESFLKSNSFSKEEKELFEPELAKLRQNNRLILAKEPSSGPDWLLPDRFPAGLATTAIPDFRQKFEQKNISFFSSTDLSLPDSSRLAQNLMFRKNGMIWPVPKPALAGNLLIAREPNALTVRDISSGQPVWSVDFGTNRIDPFIPSNRVYLSPVTNGQIVCTVEPSDASSGASQKKTAGISGNTLIARDLYRGTILWQRGPNSDASHEPVFFTGPPLLKEDRLLIIGQTSGRTALFQFSATDGKLIQKQILSMATLPQTFQNTEQNNYLPTVPVTEGGILVCSLGDLLIALDEFSFELRWAFGSSNHQKKPPVQKSGALGSAIVSCGPVLHNGIVYFVSPATETLFCLNSQTGTVLGKFPVPDFRRIVVATGQTAYLVTRTQLLAATLPESVFKEESGTKNNPKLVFESKTVLRWPDDSFPFGDGLTDGKTLCQPLEDGTLLWIDLAGGTILARQSLLPAKKEEITERSLSPAGNMVASSKGVFLQTPDGLLGFSSISAKNNIATKKESKEQNSELKKRRVSLSAIRKETGPCRWIPGPQIWPKGKYSGSRREADKKRFDHIPSVTGKIPLWCCRTEETCSCMTGLRFYLDLKGYLTILDSRGNLLTTISDRKQVLTTAAASLPAEQEKEQEQTTIEHRHQVVVQGIQTDLFIIERIDEKTFQVRQFPRTEFANEQSDLSRQLVLNSDGLLFLDRSGALLKTETLSGSRTRLSLSRLSLSRLRLPGKNELFLSLSKQGNRLFLLSVQMTTVGPVRANCPGTAVRKEWFVRELDSQTGQTIDEVKLTSSPIWIQGNLLEISVGDSGERQLVTMASLLTRKKEPPVLLQNPCYQNKNVRKAMSPEEGLVTIEMSDDKTSKGEPAGKKLACYDDVTGLLFSTTATLPGEQPQDSSIVATFRINQSIYFLWSKERRQDGTDRPIPGLSNRRVTDGKLMRYSLTGKPEWSAFTDLSDTFLFEAIPKTPPVFLFGKQVEKSDETPGWYSILAIDRETGQKSFHAKIPAGQPASSAAKYRLNEKEKTIELFLEGYEYRFTPATLY